MQRYDDADIALALAAGPPASLVSIAALGVHVRAEAEVEGVENGGSAEEPARLGVMSWCAEMSPPLRVATS